MEKSTYLEQQKKKTFFIFLNIKPSPIMQTPIYIQNYIVEMLMLSHTIQTKIGEIYLMHTSGRELY